MLILSLFTWVSPCLLVWETTWKVEFGVIYVVLFMLVSLWMDLGSRTCRFLRGSPRVCLSGDGLGKQKLSLFTWFSPCLPVWGSTWKAEFVAICVVLPMVACLGMDLESRNCSYLRGSPHVCLSGDGLGKHKLSLFAWFSPCLLV